MEYEYEIKVWRRGPSDWCFKVREKGGRFSLFDGSGISNPTKCRVKAERLIATREAELSARWKKLELV